MSIFTLPISHNKIRW